MLYFIQVTLYTGLMLMLYLLLLRDRPMHGFNRAYLLLSVVLPLVLPLLKLPQALRPQPAADSLFTSVLPGITVLAYRQQQQAVSVPIWFIVLIAVYALVVIVLLTLTLVSYLKMRRIIKRSEKIAAEKYTLLKHTGYGPGSWGRYIFLPNADVNDTIIKHEQAHILLRHSWDMVFLSIAQALLWPNLFIHFIKKELVQVHEFQADAAVAVKADEYSMLLLSSVFNTCTLPLTHSFIIHPIKRRIMMLQKNKTSGKLRSIIATSLAVAALTGIVTMQSCEQKIENEKTTVKHENLEEGVVAFAHKMPEPDYKIYEFLASNLVYPQEAKANKIEGKILVKFVVDEKGHITNIEPAKDNYNPLLAEAAVKAVAQMPDWKPGEDEKGNKVKVLFQIPIAFKLNDDLSQEDKQSLNKMINSDAFKNGEVSDEELNKLKGESGVYVQKKQNVHIDEDGTVGFAPKEWLIGVDEHGNKKKYWKVPLANTDGLEIFVDEDGNIDYKDPLNNKDFDKKVTFIAGAVDNVSPTVKNQAAKARALLTNTNSKNK